MYFFLANTEVALVPLTKIQWNFIVDFWIVEGNKLCGKQKFRLRLFQQENLDKLTPIFL